MSKDFPLWAEQDLWFIDDETDAVYTHRCRLQGTDDKDRRIWRGRDYSAASGNRLEGVDCFRSQGDALRALHEKLSEEITELEERRNSVRRQLWAMGERYSPGNQALVEAERASEAAKA